MKTRLLALLLSFVSGAASANNYWYLNCKKECSSCSETGQCGTDTNAYNNNLKDEISTSGQGDGNGALNAAENLAALGYECSVTIINSYGVRTVTTFPPNSTPQTLPQVPGISSDNYSPTSLLFDGASPDLVKYQDVNGLRIPKYMPVKGGGRVINVLNDGYEIVKYPSAALGAPDSNGIRTPANPELARSMTIYRNPDYNPANPMAPSLGNLDVIDKQRHPQSGVWVTRCTRIHAPQNDNSWLTSYYLGDPVQNQTLQPYRKITITRTPHANGTESTREITEDLNDGSYVITSDISATYAFYKFGDPVKLAETRHTGTGTEIATTWTYNTNPKEQAAFNKPATLRRSDGQWANYTYQGSPVTGILVTKTVSGWLDQAAPAVGTAPNEAASRVVVEIEAKNETGTFSREEKIQGVVVSKTWGERFKDNSGQIVEKSRVETGSATLTTIRTAFPSDAATPAAQRGRMKSVENPDGTLSLYAYSLQGANRVETVDSGSGTLSGVTDGTRTVSTYTKDDTLIKEVVSDIASGVILSTREAIAFDANDEPTRWAFDNDPDDYSETLNGCCGIDSTRSRDGILTTYTRDGLKRPKTAISQGITLTYTYGKKTIGSTDFPSVSITATAGSLTLNQGSTVYDHAGNVIQQISPDLNGDGNEEITATTRDFSTRTTTVTNPGGGTIVSTDFADGQSQSTTGTATAPRFYSYSTHNEQGGGELTATAPTANGPWNLTYTNLAGQTLKTVFSPTLITDPSALITSTNTFDSLGRVISTTDADGVTQLLAYNAQGEAYRQAIDLNQNNEIDSADRITDTVQDVVDESPIGAAIRSTSIIYDLDNNPVTLSTSYRSPDGLTTRQESLGVANPSTSVSASHLDRADGSWTDTTTNPDGTRQVTEYSNWLPVTQASYSSLPSSALLSSVSTGYDALRRPVSQTHSRTASAVVTRTAYHATNGLVVSVTEDLTTGTDRVTSFTYDSMGRRTSTTLPDNSATYMSYWPTGQEKASYGSKTNPTVKLYTAEGQLHKLRTFRSANLALAPDENTANYDETTWTYNNRNQLTRKQYADGKGTDYTYTAGGKLYTRTWARTVEGDPLVTTYGYNDAGELTTTDYSDSTPDVTIVFDNLGRQESITNGVATSVFAYDPATLALDTETITYNLPGQPVFSRVLDRSRDTLGRDTGYTLRSADVSSAPETQAKYTYHATTGRLATIRSGDVSSPQTFTYGYTPNSSLLQTVTGPVHTVTNTYEPTRNVLDIKENKAGTTSISKYDYLVNAIGQRTNVSTSGTAFPATPSWSWGYDSLGQVISADSSVNTSDRTYQYDAIGNRKKSADGLTLPGSDNYTSNELNQYSSLSLNSQPATLNDYDDDGNLTSGQLPTGSAGLVWDAENRLIAVNVLGQDTIHYTYDAQSRRISRSVGVSPTASNTIHIYDAWNVIAEYSIQNSTSSIQKSYLWGTDLSGSLQGAGGVGGLLSVNIHDPQSMIHYPLFDGNGNVSEYLAADGSTAAHFEYDPFGNTIVNTDTNNQFTYRFSTKPLDQVTGLLYYGYRYYDPVTGRWPSRDPIEERGGINLYGFIKNDGGNTWDYLGFWTGNQLLQEALRYQGERVLFAAPLGPGWIKVTAFLESSVKQCFNGSYAEVSVGVEGSWTIGNGIDTGIGDRKKPRPKTGGGGRRKKVDPPLNPDPKVGDKEHEGGGSIASGMECCPEKKLEWIAYVKASGKLGVGVGVEILAQYDLLGDDLLSFENLTVGANYGWIGYYGSEFKFSVTGGGTGIIPLN
jgi:RHS repeat-associated protein